MHGCCPPFCIRLTLLSTPCTRAQVENVECIEPNHIRFDFLGKDSMRYENTVEVSAAGATGWQPRPLCCRT